MERRVYLFILKVLQPFRSVLLFLVILNNIDGFKSEHLSLFAVDQLITLKKNILKVYNGENGK